MYLIFNILIMKPETLKRITKEQLELEYCIRKKSYRDICKEYNFNNRTVKKLLDYYKIKIRYWTEAVKSQWEWTKWEKRKEKCYNKRKDKLNCSWYIFINDKDYYRANNYWRVREHIYIMEKYLWRKLKKDEVIHHIDWNKQNNNINNLQVMTKSEHSRLHYKERNIDEKGRLVKVL